VMATKKWPTRVVDGCARASGRLWLLALLLTF